MLNCELYCNQITIFINTMPNSTIYLDYNATTPVAKEVLDEMLPYFSSVFGNAASRTHVYGWEADDAIQTARTRVADLIEVDPKEIIFTSGATESDNLGLKGMFEAFSGRGNHIITSGAEHKAVLDACKHIESFGGEVTYLPTEDSGRIDLEKLQAAIRPETVLVSIMYVNNETGVIQPMEDIARICKSRNILFMSDATQAVGKILVQPKSLGIDLMAFSAHKFYGPKGIGGLYVTRDKEIDLREQINGGGHERGYRSGTLNVPGIVGLGMAAQIAKNSIQDDSEKLGKLRDHLESTLIDTLPKVYLNGSKNNRIYQTSNLYFEGVDSEQLLLALSNHIAISSGSACNSAAVLPSHVLLNMGHSRERAMSSIRFSLGRFTTGDEIDRIITKVSEAINRIREENPVWAE